jgi:hypothetical protein
LEISGYDLDSRMTQAKGIHSYIEGRNYDKKDLEGVLTRIENGSRLYA